MLTYHIIPTEILFEEYDIRIWVLHLVVNLRS